MTATVWFFVLTLCCPFPAYKGDVTPTTIKVSKNSEEGCAKVLRVLSRQLQENQLKFTVTQQCRAEDAPVAAGQPE